MESTPVSNPTSGYGKDRSPKLRIDIIEESGRKQASRDTEGSASDQKCVINNQEVHHPWAGSP